MLLLYSRTVEHHVSKTSSLGSRLLTPFTHHGFYTALYTPGLYVMKPSSSWTQAFISHMLHTRKACLHQQRVLWAWHPWSTWFSSRITLLTAKSRLATAAFGDNRLFIQSSTESTHLTAHKADVWLFQVQKVLKMTNTTSTLNYVCNTYTSMTIDGHTYCSYNESAILSPQEHRRISWFANGLLHTEATGHYWPA